MAMRPPLPTDPTDPITRWLDAERDDRTGDAEALLLELFQSLPPLAPSAGFADRVLRRIEPASAPVPVQSWLGWLFGSPGFRLVLASCLLAAGISLLWLPQALTALAGMVTVGDMVQIGVASVVDLGRWLGVAARLGEWFLTVLGALGVSLTSPAALKVTVACLAISGISVAFLRELIRDRSLRYVDSNR